MKNTPLLSEVLKNETERAIRLADETDVKALHDFLFAEPQKPMLFVGSGGMQGHYAGLLYEQNAGIARCITPFTLRSMSDDTLRGCRCLLMSAGGKNMDIKAATKRMMDINPENTAAFTYWNNEKNIFAGNHTRHEKRAHSLPESEVAVVLLVSPDEDRIATNIRKTVPNGDWQVLPNETPIITIKTGFDTPLASIDLSIKANVFFADLAENYHGFNPLNPPNYGGVRKEYPMGGLRW